MTQRRALVVGASRGIGLGLVRAFAARGYEVFATRRSPSEGLTQAAAAAGGDGAGGAIRVLEADVTDADAIAALAGPIGAGALDVLVLNAGVYGPDGQGLADLGRDDVAEILMTNAVGPAQAALALLPLVRDGGTIGMMTSKMGSIDDSSGGFNHYRLSKVAQNMLSRSLFEDHARARGIAVLSLHPGWVRTDMGGPNAPIAVEESAAGMADLLEAQRPPEHRFLSYDGSEVPW